MMVMKLKLPFTPYQLRKFRKKYFSQSVSQESGEDSQDQSGMKKGGKKSEFGP